MRDYRRDVNWILHLLTPLGTTGKYSAIADFHTLKITTAPDKPFPACCVFTSRSPITASNSGDSSASRTQVLPSPTFVQNCLPALHSPELDRHLFSTSLAELDCAQHSTSRLKCQPSTDSQSPSARLGSSLYSHGADPTENTIS
jgi:hypothetical protein